METLINIDQNFLNYLAMKRIPFSSSDNTQMHIAITFVGKQFRIGSILSYGINYPVNVHAEINAIDNIPTYKTNKTHKNKKKISKKIINVMVLRINKSGNLIMSRPCKHCIQSMYNKKYKFENYRNDGFNKVFKLENKFDSIKYVFYSDEKGNIVRKKLNDLFKSKDTLVISSGNRKWAKHHKEIACETIKKEKHKK